MLFMEGPYSYLRFAIPHESVGNPNSGILEHIAVYVAKKIVPAANPDFDMLIPSVVEWLVEFNGEEIAWREVGLDATGKAILKMPSKENVGYWVDNTLQRNDFSKHFEVREIEAQEFEFFWNNSIMI